MLPRPNAAACFLSAWFILLAGAPAPTVHAGTPQGAPAAVVRKTLNDELVAYLRCEPGPRRDSVGNVQPPDLLAMEDRYTAKAPSGAPALPIAVWKGADATLEVVAGYGYFGVIQHYAADSAPSLLANFAKNGWHMKRQTFADLRDYSAKAFPEEAKSIVVLRGTRQDGAYRRTLTLVEARADLSKEAHGLFPYERGGVTVYCEYSTTGDT